MEKHGHHYVETPVKLIVRVLQDLLRTAQFDTYADLADELKWRCATLKVPYDGGLVSDAIARLEEHGRKPLIPAPVTPTRIESKRVERPAERSVINAAEATRIIERLKVDIKSPRPVRELSGIEVVDRMRAQDRRKALRIVQEEILATIARVEALEAIVEKSES